MEMTTKRCNNTPAARLIARFGAKALAAWTGRHPSRVHAWAWSTGRGGTGGVVPVRLRSSIIRGAMDDCRAVLTPADFEPGEGEAYAFEDQAA